MSEIFVNGKKVAFALCYPKDQFFSNLGDIQVYEENHIGDDKFKQTALFITMSDAEVYLNSKYRK